MAKDALVLSKNNNNFLLALLKGAFVAILISLVGILLFALFLKFVDISDGWIMPINQVIKVVSVFFGVKSMITANGGSGLIKGLVLGVVYTILAFIIFSLLSSTLELDITLLFDALFGAVIGAICGIICISAKK